MSLKEIAGIKIEKVKDDMMDMVHEQRGIQNGNNHSNH